MFDKFELVMVIVSDMDRSVAFYRDVLGLKLLFQSPQWSQFDVGGVGLGLHPQGKDVDVQPKTGISFGFSTPDIEKTLVDLASKGAKVTKREKDDHVNLAVIADPDDYGIMINQPR
jgi:catechol 2,3-dioxygenase-like lactoylglutathione lyase family enzyme